MTEEMESGLPWESAFIANFKARREKLNMTQAAAAKKVASSGLPFYQQTIQRIEDGKRPVRINEALVLAAAVGMTLDELIPLGDANDRVLTGMQDTYFQAEDLQDVIHRLRLSYDRLILRSRLAAKNDGEFAQWLRDRLQEATDQQASRLAKSQRLDPDSDEVAEMLKYNPSPVMKAAGDALRDVEDQARDWLESADLPYEPASSDGVMVTVHPGRVPEMKVHMETLEADPAPEGRDKKSRQ